MTVKSTNYELPSPVDSEPPNGPAQIKALADALDVLKWGSRSLKPELGILRNTGSSTALSTSHQTILELAIHPPVASKIILVGSVPVLAPPTSHAVNYELDEVSQGDQIHHGTAGENGNPDMTVLSLTAAAHTIKLRALRVEGSGGTVGLGAAQLLYLVFAS